MWRSTLSTRISQWRSESHHRGRSRAKRREEVGKKSTWCWKWSQHISGRRSGRKRRVKSTSWSPSAFLFLFKITFQDLGSFNHWLHTSSLYQAATSERKEIKQKLLNVTAGPKAGVKSGSQYRGVSLLTAFCKEEVIQHLSSSTD